MCVSCRRGCVIIADVAGICSLTPGTGLCLTGEELTLPAHWEGILRLTEPLQHTQVSLLALLGFLCRLCPHPVARLA